MVIDNRIRENILPVSVVLQSCAENAEALLCADFSQIGLRDKNLAVIKAGGFIVLDFGKELHGSIRLLTAGVSGSSKIRLRVGESVSESCAELGEKGACNDHSLRDITVPMVALSDMQFLQSGFRFLRIDALEDTVITLKAVCAVYIHTASKRIGSFKCSDKLINDIFDTAAHTVELCMQTMIWDGIKRDRLVWIGDMHPETRAICALYGNDEIINRTLDFEKEQSPMPGGWMNGFPQYSMWWIVILNDYFMATGNLEYLKEQKAYFLQLLEQIDNCVFDNGDFDFGFNFVDWPTHEQPDEPEGVRSLCKYSMLKAKNICDILGVDCLLPQKIYQKLSLKSNEVIDKKQISALKYLSETALSEHEKGVLLNGGAKGFSTFMSSYILTAVTENSSLKDALSAMRDYYGGMLKMGATSFWEDFDVDWMENTAPLTRLPKDGERDIHGDFGKFCYIGFRHSFCHGWSAGVVPFIFDKLVGVTILEAGGKKLKIEPDLADLEYFEATYPTAYGAVEIYCDKNGLKVTAPKQVEIVK